MNEEAVRDALVQAGIPCQITGLYNDLTDGEVTLTGTPFHIQVGQDYLVVVRVKKEPYQLMQCAEFTKLTDLVEQVRTVLEVYRLTN